MKSADIKDKKFNEWVEAQRTMLVDGAELNMIRLRSAFDSGWWSCEIAMNGDDNQDPIQSGRLYIGKKPPPGVMPHKIWLEKRIAELTRAIHGYANESMFLTEPMRKWVDELKEHLDALDRMQGEMEDDQN